MAICWEPLFYSLAQSVGYLEGLILLRILRDYTPESFCCGFIFNTPLCKSAGSKNFNRTSLHKVRLGSAGGQPCLYSPRLFKRTKYTLSSDLSGEDKHFNNLPFFSYLTGLIEGDGTIVVPKTERSTKGVLNYASVEIVFHLKDLPLALIIQKALGDGSIARKKGVNAYILTINSYKGLILIVPQQKIKRV